MSFDNQKLENLAVVVFDASAVTGTVSTDDSLGNKAFTSRGVRYIDPKKLNPFTAIRQSTHAELLRIGTRFLSGYAVPLTMADKASEILAEKQSKWEAEANNLVQNFDTYVEQWKHDKEEVRGYSYLFPDSSWIARRIGFEWTMFHIEPRESGIPGMSKMIGRMPAQVLSEIVQDVKNSWTPSAQKMDNRTRGILERVMGKLGAMSFLNPELGLMADKIKAVLTMLPESGIFNQAEMVTASVVLGMLSSERSAHELLTLNPSVLDCIAVPEKVAPAANFVFESEEPVTEVVAPVVKTEAVTEDDFSNLIAEAMESTVPQNETSPEKSAEVEDEFVFSFG